MKKTILITLCVLLLLSSLCACRSILPNDNGAMQPTEEGVRFDLSQYVDHGDLSCGRIWVIKEESSWDSEPQEYFAYLDVDGNVIYDWQCVDTFTRTGPEGPFYPQDEVLGDYINGFALIYQQHAIQKGGFADAVVINRDGREIAEFIIKAHEEYAGDFTIDYVDFNAEGYAFFVGKLDREESYSMYFIDASGAHPFQCKKDDVSILALRKAEMLDDKYIYLGAPNFQLYNRSGELLADLGKNCQISPDYISIIDDTYIEAAFTGKDDKQYMCILDFYGNMLTEPVLGSKYQRNLENLDKPSAELAPYMVYIGRWYAGAHYMLPYISVNEDLTWYYRNGDETIVRGTVKLSDEGLELYDEEGVLAGLMVKQTDSKVWVEAYSWRFSDGLSSDEFVKM